MKKYFIGAILVLSTVACSNKEAVRKYELGEYYRKDQVVYSLEDNKPLNGVIVEEDEYYKIYMINIYEDGNLIEAKLIEGDQLIFQSKLKNGFVHGYVNMEKEGDTMSFNFDNGIMQGDIEMKEYYREEHRRLLNGLSHGPYRVNGETFWYNYGELVEDESKVEEVAKIDYASAISIEDLDIGEEYIVDKKGNRYTGLFLNQVADEYKYVYVEDGKFVREDVFVVKELQGMRFLDRVSDQINYGDYIIINDYSRFVKTGETKYYFDNSKESEFIQFDHDGKRY